MDVENLAKELILKNMTPEQQMAVLDSVRSSVAQAKEVQKRKIGENVDLVVQALKKIESDIRSRFDDVGNAIEKRVASIQDGRDGINGKDGRDGKDGKSGRDGAKGDKGDAGRDGRDGVDGTDGISVTSARIDFDGSLVITLSSGVELNVGEVVAPDLAERIKVITNGGGTSQSVLDTLASLQAQITALIPSQTGNSGKYLTTNGTTLSWASVAGGLTYQGTWNATTNTPTLTSSVGTNGYYYIVATAGSTNLNGITDWQIGDWLMFNGSVWQKIDQSNLVTSVNGQTGAVSLTYTDVNAIGSITSTDGSVTVSTTSGIADLSVAVSASTTNVIVFVRNATGATLTKGTAVYINGATGQNPTVTKAQANNDTNSAQTLGLMSADLANNSNGYVTVIGLITNINTSSFTDGQQLYLSPTTAGTLTATKPYAPQHLVYVAVVEHAHPTQGKLFVKIQNGYEMDELHNVSAQSPSNGQTLIYNTSTSLWEKANLTAGTGISVSNGAGSITVNNTGVTSVSVTSPVASTGGTTPTISLAASYGDTQNPYASKTANYVLAAPNGSAGVPTFRAIVAADIPTLNQNTTGTASNVTGTVAIANGGTGQTTATAAFNALAPSQTSAANKFLQSDGTNTSFAIENGGFIWQSVKTADFAVTVGNGYPVNTTSAAITATLPASPSVGQVVSFVDYAGTWATNNLTISPNGNKFNGSTSSVVCSANREGVVLVYIDATQGWAYYAGYNPIKTFSADYLLIAGGGGGGGNNTTPGGGGGAAGGYRSFTQQLTTGVAYLLTVGAGGTAGVGNSSVGGNGSNSVFTTNTSIGGGGGGNFGVGAGANGGSGGGGALLQNFGTGNTPNTAPSQGNNGGAYNVANTGLQGGGGGGGASAVGSNASSTDQVGGNGGAGTSSSITGSSVQRAGGGGGGGGRGAAGTFAGGTATGGGGAGGTGQTGTGTAGTAGTANPGGGGGGGGGSSNSVAANGGAGGSGVVIIKVPNTRTATFSGGVTSSSASVTGFTIYTVTATSTTSETVTFS